MNEQAKLFGDASQQHPLTSGKQRSSGQSRLIRSKGRILDGHVVIKVIWETASAVVFADEQSWLWRYLHAYKRAWPIIVEGSQHLIFAAKKETLRSP